MMSGVTGSDSTTSTTAPMGQRLCVRIVGTGLLGASLGQALRRAGHEVFLWDPSPTALGLATALRAGAADTAEGGRDEVQLVVVAAPPDVAGAVVAAELKAHPSAIVTDVASVKTAIFDYLALDAALSDADRARYLGGHPMAGREKSGTVAARSDLFVAASWILCPSRDSAQFEHPGLPLVQHMLNAVGARGVLMSAVDHDQAVALVSHVPQVAASLVASQLRSASDEALGVAGAGLRDLTRIADSDPMLWAQILRGNASSMRDALQRMRQELDTVIDALAEGPDGPNSTVALANLIAHGNAGRERIPGKHGRPAIRFSTVTVLISDESGELGRLFAEVGAADINIEEVDLEHAPGQELGLATLSVQPRDLDRLETVLVERGWRIVT